MSFHEKNPFFLFKSASSFKKRIDKCIRDQDKYIEQKKEERDRL